ncbi:DUF4432 family protein [Sinorhizobium terangae]|uniref:DUF4432 family protein n=1 Tax=Sinorhizobium terangae TaxID=110322 RepID=A0A6N7L684_SINTE|nr:DUF4432 family protein [Sinorhizobium terangae]MBB4185481.1 hypothetical protein [Sinorhizobium terangae]MQX13242.1 DUF4432 family protein [Sinorhizobium terangae]WFU46447.1 DUF4432 family protein [Sinorhizobium terangae]
METTLCSTRDGVSGHLLFDRSSALDIAAFVFDGTDLSPGLAIPSDGDHRIDHALAGFLFTCGPDHIRHPEAVEGRDDGRRYPLHGSLAGTPVIRAEMSADGTRCQALTEVDLASGGKAAVERRWSVAENGQGVVLEDRVTNVGDSAFAPMMMYHMNIGGRLLGRETRIVTPSLESGLIGWQFGEGESAHFCIPAHHEDGWSEVSLTPLPGLGGRRLAVRFRVDTLPFLQMWRCQRGGANVISIEPASHRLAKRVELATSGELGVIEPGQSRSYALAFTVT